MGLELDHVPGLRRLLEPDGDRIERAAEVPAMGFDPPLPAGLGIDVQHGGAGGAQVAHEPGLLQLSGLEQTEDTAGELRPGDPAEVVPERASQLLPISEAPRCSRKPSPRAASYAA